MEEAILDEVYTKMVLDNSVIQMVNVEGFLTFHSVREFRNSPTPQFSRIWMLAAWFAGAEAARVEKNPFTAKASLIHSWNNQITSDKLKPWFFLNNKASPLDAVDLATFSKLVAADEDRSSATSANHFQTFCSKANLLCIPEISTSLVNSNIRDANFVSYGTGRSFTNYGTKQTNAGQNSFKNYPMEQGAAINSFGRYSRSTIRRDDVFTNYAHHANTGDQKFDNYGSAADSAGKFSNYGIDDNVPVLRFNLYSVNSERRNHSFTSYSSNANAGELDFTSYARNAINSRNDFNAYSNESNVIHTNFTNYG
ncbi:OLC1v1028267C1 [Oldenlandia corymbosa var. corymbosa]|uniref:OLC1v1028267C1 n=1 Tax=Oldenlandia corymbosa var. corymbosa TaxID=529605 RepID=A0AAV1CBD1_OLDCO|nr:OLC1v1028267C1 [Oldenlandia corymbosa var. corymbosa]